LGEVSHFLNYSIWRKGKGYKGKKKKRKKRKRKRKKEVGSPTRLK
jgi:hypothetical protein